MIKGIEVDRLFDSMLDRMTVDPKTGYDRDFWTVFEEHIVAGGLFSDPYGETDSVLIATREHLALLAVDWMKKVDDANDNLREAARRERLGLPE